MSRRTHTPGPWTWLPAFRSGRHYSVMLDAIESGSTVLYHDALWVPKKADARLIAAAPDLLAALTQSLEWLASYPGGCAAGAYDKAHVAIAKAEGRQP